MATPQLKEIYETIRDLSLRDRLRLVEQVLRDAQESMPTSTEPRPLGIDAGKIWIAEDFDAPLPDDIQRLFNGES